MDAIHRTLDLLNNWRLGTSPREILLSNQPQPIPLISNPTAGRGRGRQATTEIAQAINHLGRQVELYITTGPREVERLAGNLARAGAETIVVCGGDGTLQKAVRGLAGSETRLVIAPGGRGNDFYQSLGLPGEVDRVAQLALGWESRTIDLGLVGPHYFCTVAAFGFDAHVSRISLDLKIPLGGQAAYLYSILRGLIQYKPLEVKLTWEDGSYQGPVFMVSSGNTDSYGGRIKITPQARADDGKLDVCIVAPVNRRRALRLLPVAVKGEHEGQPEVIFIRTSWLSIETEKPSEIWADGDPVATTPQTLTIEPAALKVGV